LARNEARTGDVMAPGGPANRRGAIGHGRWMLRARVRRNSFALERGRCTHTHDPSARRVQQSAVRCHPDGTDTVALAPASSIEYTNALMPRAPWPVAV